jgi:phosphatidylinositol glycan class B
MPQRKDAQLLLFLPLAVGLLLRLRLAVTDHGIFWPDEIYQSFEPAHALVFGHGLIPWEFIDGARNWALPGLVAGLLKLCALAGLGEPTTYVPVVKGFFALVSTATALGTYRLARTAGGDEREAAAAAAVFSLAAPVLYFAPRAMSENATALPVVWGLALVLDRALMERAAVERRARQLVVLGASLLGLAVLLRLQSAIFCVGVVGVLAARRQWRGLRDVGVTLAVWALLFGALDAATWHDAPGAKAGGWFHSAVVYLRFNLIEGKAAGWGTAPWYFFFQRLFTSMPFVTVLLALALPAGARRAPALAVVGLLFFALHSASPHKEYRFILPVLPVLAALLAAGLTSVRLERLRAAGVGLVVVAAVLSAATADRLTFGQLGQYPGRGADSAWDDNGPVNRLMLVASQQADLCGLFTPVHPAWMGGATYLHRRAPLYAPNWPYDCVQAGTCNYAILPKGANLPVVAEDKDFVLARVPNSPCRQDAAYVWRLP